LGNCFVVVVVEFGPIVDMRVVVVAVVVVADRDNVGTRVGEDVGTWLVNNLLEMVVIVIVVALKCWWQNLWELGVCFVVVVEFGPFVNMRTVVVVGPLPHSAQCYRLHVWCT
jgi:hypothetical protein